MLGELTQEEIGEMLNNNSVGRIGCNDGEKTYVVPVTYVPEQSGVLCHSKDGMKIEMMRRNPEVCFEVDDIKDYNHWTCVIAWGTYEELISEGDIIYARQFFSDYMLQQKTAETALPPHTQEERFHDVKPEYAPAIYYRIIFHKITGRYEHAL
jgi:nitroimidazol reductase NimA-like FMN-containing flavoprotein (pyridoxamine 5'-phosphate oxidase superfamily)